MSKCPDCGALAGYIHHAGCPAWKRVLDARVLDALKPLREEQKMQIERDEAARKAEVEAVGNLPTNAKVRKAVPIYSGVVKYFPRALAAIAELSRIGNEQHNPGQPLHWDKSKSTDHLDCLARHLCDCGTVDIDKVLHDTKVAWRGLANLETVLEAREKAGQSSV